MSNFYTKDTLVNASHYDENFYYLGSSIVHVAKGCTLPPNCTDKVFTPTDLSKVGLFEPVKKTWSEVATDRGKEYYDAKGTKFIHHTHLEPLPAWAITTPPPALAVNEVAHHDGNGWVKKENTLGKGVYSQDGTLSVCTISHYTLASDESFDSKPITNPKTGHAWKIVSGKWKEVKYRKDVTVYCKRTGQTHILLDVWGKIPTEYTEKEYKVNHVWDATNNTWKLDPAQEANHRKENEKGWAKEQEMITKDKLLYELLDEKFNTARVATNIDTNKLFKYLTAVQQYGSDPKPPFNRPVL